MNIHGLECDQEWHKSCWPTDATDFGLVDFHARYLMNIFHARKMEENGEPDPNSRWMCTLPMDTALGDPDPNSPCRWMCTLPMGGGLGRTAEEAIANAAAEQHYWLEQEKHGPTPWTK